MIRCHKLIFAIILGCFLLSCRNDEEVADPDFPIACDYSLGYFELLPESYTATPYDGVNQIIFQDSMGNEIALNDSVEIVMHQPVSYSHTDSTDYTRKKYCWYQDRKTFLFTNDSLKLTLRVSIFPTLYIDSPMEKLIKDILSINLKQEGWNPISSTIGNFVKTINQRTYPTLIPTLELDSITCLDKVFYNAQYVISPSGGGFYFYYNSTYGVIAFKDAYGKKWRFERFE